MPSSRPWQRKGPSELAAAQLARELADRLAPFHRIAPAAGVAPGFPAQSLEQRDAALVLGSLDLDTTQAIVAALWPTGVEHWWWQTPLGRTVAAPLADATPEEDTIKVSEAARMPGMSHARVVQLADDTRPVRSVTRRIAGREEHGESGCPSWRSEGSPGHAGTEAAGTRFVRIVEMMSDDTYDYADWQSVLDAV